MSFSSRAACLLAVVGCLLAVRPVASEAQVVIRERIELSPRTTPPPAEAPAVRAAAPAAHRFPGTGRDALDLPVDPLQFGPVRSYQLVYPQFWPTAGGTVASLTAATPGQAPQGAIEVFRNGDDGYQLVATMPLGGGWLQSDTYPVGPVGDSCGDGVWHYTEFAIQSAVPVARVPNGAGLAVDLALDANQCDRPNSVTNWCGCHLDPTWPVKYASNFDVWRPHPSVDIEPSALLVTPTPDTLDVGAAASLAVRLIDGHGYEVDLAVAGGFSDATPVTLAAPADSAAGRGLVLGGAAAAAQVATTYGAARSGAVGYAAGADSVWYDTPVSVGARGGGYSGSGRLVVRGTRGTGPDSLVAETARDALACGDSTLLTLRGLLGDEERSLPDSARVTVALADSAHVVVSAGGVRGPTVSAAALADNTVYLVTEACDDVTGEFDVAFTVTVEAPWAEGGALTTSGGIRVRPPPPPPLDFVVLPDTLRPGQEGTLTLTTPLPGDTPLLVGITDGGVVTFVTPPPARGGAVRMTSSTRVTTTADGLANLRLRMNPDLDGIASTVVNVTGAGSSGRTRVVADGSLLLRFIRQDNTAVPPDSCLMVSRLPPDATTLRPPGLAYGALPSATPDPYTYRVEASGVFTGSGYAIRLTTNHGQPNAYAATYPVVDNGSVPVRSYRMNQDVRLVSNGRPSFGADPAGTYDDEFAGDQTLLVRLGDTVRAEFVDGSGTVLATANRTVGCSPSTPGPHPQAIRTAELYLRNYVGVSSNPAVMAEKASEDWAQAAIRFDLPIPNVGSSVAGVQNILLIRGRPSQDSVVVMDVIRDPYGLRDSIRVVVSVLGGDSESGVASKVAAAISSEASLYAESREYFVSISDSESGYWVITNRGEEIGYENIVAPGPLQISQVQFDFPPIAPGGPYLDDAERESLSRNFKNGSADELHVFVVPDGAFRPPVSGGAVNGRTTVAGDFASKSVVFVTESAANGQDQNLPFTFGHELGHALGLRHFVSSVSQKRNLMYETSPIGGDVEDTSARKRLVGSQAATGRASSLLQNR